MRSKHLLIGKLRLACLLVGVPDHSVQAAREAAEEQLQDVQRAQESMLFLLRKLKRLPLKREHDARKMRVELARKTGMSEDAGATLRAICQQPSPAQVQQRQLKETAAK